MKIIIEKINRKTVFLKCNGCEECEFHSCFSSLDPITHQKEWYGYCNLYHRENGMPKCLASEGGINYNKHLKMMKTGLHPEGKRFLWKDVKKFIKKENK